MGILKWNADLNMDIQEIDEQHKRLIDMINVFYETLSVDHRKALGELLGGLIDYTGYHFATEERYMARFQFEEAAQHKSEHDAFVAKVRNVAERYKGGKLVVSVEVTNYLKDWIVNHIRSSDRRYAACFKTNGLH